MSFCDNASIRHCKHSSGFKSSCDSEELGSFFPTEYHGQFLLPLRTGYSFQEALSSQCHMIEETQCTKRDAVPTPGGSTLVYQMKQVLTHLIRSE